MFVYFLHVYYTSIYSYLVYRRTRIRLNATSCRVFYLRLRLSRCRYHSVFGSIFERTRDDVFRDNFSIIKFVTIVLRIILWYFLHTISIVDGTRRPIIGILAQEYFNKGSKSGHDANVTYIAASYVKAVEASGARVIPIFTHRNETYYRHVLGSINGVLIPGGGSKLRENFGYYDAAKIIYKLVVEMNELETAFPLYGVCLGFEALIQITNDDKQIRTLCKIFDNLPLEIDRSAASAIFSKMPVHIIDYISENKSLFNHHKWCFTKQNITDSSKLDAVWKVTSQSTSRRGFKFVSTVEHRKYPIWGTQFHPEKYFEWNTSENLPHSRNDLIADRYFYDIFVEAALRNDNRYESPQEERTALIYNYNPVYTNKNGNAIFDQAYLFYEYD